MDAEKVSYEGQRDRIRCSSCGAEARKEEMALAQTQFLEDGHVQWRPKRVPVSIVYKIGSKVYEKKPDQFDFDVLGRIEELEFPLNFPHVSFRSSKTFNEGRMRTTNTRNTRSIFLPRAAHALAKLWALAERESNKKLRVNLLYPTFPKWPAA